MRYFSTAAPSLLGGHLGFDPRLVPLEDLLTRFHAQFHLEQVVSPGYHERYHDGSHACECYERGDVRVDYQIGRHLESDQAPDWVHRTTALGNVCAHRSCRA